MLAAYADPDYRCPLCGLTLDEGRRLWGDNAEWERGHKIPGRQAHSSAEYEAQHAHCNRGRDNNRTRYRKHSRRW